MMYCLSVSLSGAGESGKSTIVKQMKYDKAIDYHVNMYIHVHVHSTCSDVLHVMVYMYIYYPYCM